MWLIAVIVNYVENYFCSYSLCTPMKKTFAVMEVLFPNFLEILSVSIVRVKKKAVDEMLSGQDVFS